MQIIGICRFSYPAEGGFQRLHGTIEERTAYLYDENRLARRFITLETVTLPSIEAQTDGDFTFVIVIGSSLPADAKKRLYSKTAHIPQVIVVERDSGPYRPTMQDVMDQIRDPRADICIQFRLDDDDGVGVDFIAELRKASARSNDLLRYGGKFAVDFSSGFTASFSPKGVKMALVQKQLWTPALAIVLLPRCKRSILNYGHHLLANEMPVVTLPNHNMFIRSFHGDNDSLAVRIGASFDYADLDDFTTRYLKKTFNFDHASAEEAWLALS